MPPRVVLILTPSVRLLGARRSLLALATSLDPERWRPVVCGQSEGDLSEALRAAGVPFETVFTGWWRKGKYWLWRPFAIARLARRMSELGVDLVHCNEPYPNPFAVRAAEGRGRRAGEPIPVVAHMRLSFSREQIRKYDLRRAARVLVPSEAAGRDFDHWPDKAARVRVIPNGVDLAEFARGRSRTEARRAIGLPEDGPLFGAIGQVGPRKGGDRILSAMRRVLERWVEPGGDGAAPPRLMFLGDPHRGQEAFAASLRRRVEDDPLLRGRVHFLPFATDVLPYYEALDVNLLISRDEGFGRTLIEAGALGAPSIGSRVGGIPEIVADGESGLLVEPEDDEALAPAMERLARDAGAREAMGAAARRRVEERFSIAAHARRVMDAYDEAAGAQGA